MASGSWQPLGRLMPARERERGALPSPNLSSLGRKAGRGLIVSATPSERPHHRSSARPLGNGGGFLPEKPRFSGCLREPPARRVHPTEEQHRACGGPAAGAGRGVFWRGSLLAPNFEPPLRRPGAGGRGTMIRTVAWSTGARCLSPLLAEKARAEIGAGPPGTGPGGQRR